ncbi:MAG: bacteriocin [Butyrivibrio sp.]|nr:bacteriocin [Butyrivibrio sp.]
MKLIGDLKENVEKAKEIIKKAGMELTDDEMENISGGFSRHPAKLYYSDTIIY